jgi:hypothetical protein
MKQPAMVSNHTPRPALREAAGSESAHIKARQSAMSDLSLSARQRSHFESFPHRCVSGQFRENLQRPHLGSDSLSLAWPLVVDVRLRNVIRWGCETLWSWAKSKERHNPLQMTGTWLATAGFPTPKGLDAHPQFFGALLPGFPQF